jgi:2-polyprenyl-6-methoxyphenol hydroxylase-like FAD-dependent oxidoreductase
MVNRSRVLITGASFAGITTALLLNRQGYEVTVVEISTGLKRGGTPVNLKGQTFEALARMGLLETIQSKKLHVAPPTTNHGDGVDELVDPNPDENEIEIERDDLLDVLFDATGEEVEWIFGDSVLALQEEEQGLRVTFEKAGPCSFDLVLGCDGVRSALREIWFGKDKHYAHFLQAYGSVTIVNKSLIPENSSEMYREPGKAISLNAYNQKTDIILIFASPTEIEYDHRDREQKRAILVENFAGVPWRGQDWLAEVRQSPNLYFDKLWQIKMPAWSKGRVALVGDAGYCASPAAGRGGSLAIDGAVALAAALQKCEGNFESAFQEYDRSFRPFVEKVQAEAVYFVSQILSQPAAKDPVGIFSPPT